MTQANDDEWDEALRLAQVGEPGPLQELICTGELTRERRQALRSLVGMLCMRLPRKQGQVPLGLYEELEIRRTWRLFEAARAGEVGWETLGFGPISAIGCQVMLAQLHHRSVECIKDVIARRGAYAPGARLRRSVPLLRRPKGFPRWKWS